MSSKSKRRVTVDPGNTVSEDAEKRKPSVFERLGPGAGQRKYSEYDSEREKKCRPFLLTGECPYGATCKYKHVQLSRKSRSREEDASPENLRLKLKGSQTERGGDKRRDSDSESRDPPARPSSHARREKDPEGGERADRPSRRDKETKIRSQVVVKKSENQDSDDSGDDSESNWFNSLDYKKELELEQKRQQLQRELSQLAEEEVENITIQKKVPVSPSDSDSSPERGRPSKRMPSPHDKRIASPHDKRSTSPSGRSKKEKKKHRTKSPPEVPLRDKKISSPPVADKPREHKRKHETEEEPHKKHKKKKERKRSLSPPPPALARGRKKDKWGEESESSVSRSHADTVSSSRLHSHPHSKHSRSSSSDSSPSPPRPKDIKVKAKAKAKKKKSRAGKGESDSDESHSKSKKWLSPLKKTLKLKKAKASAGVGDARADEERIKQRSASPKASRRGDRRDPLGEDSVPPSRSHESRRESDVVRSRGHSLEKRDKKMKVRPSESPDPPLDRSGSSKRGDASRDTSFGRKNRQSESPAVPADRSSRRGENTRDMPFDRRKLDQRDRVESRKGGGEERQKRPPSPPRQSEMYSPSQLDRESPQREPSQRQQQAAPRGRQAEREPLPRDEERRGQDRDGRRGEKFEARSSSASQDRAGQERFSRRSDGDSFDQYGQDRGQFDADCNRWEYRDSRAPEAGGDREQRGRRGDHFERGSSQRDPPRGEGMGREVPFDRPDSGRGTGSRDARDLSRDNEGRDRGRDAARDRGDNRSRDRDGRLPVGEGGKYGSGSFVPEGQRRSGQWEAGNRSGEWGGDRADLPRDLGGGRLDERGRVSAGGGSVGSGSSGGRMYRDDGRESGDRRGREAMVAEGHVSLEGGRLDRPEGRADRGDGRLERGDNRIDRGDGRIDRGDVRLDRGDSRGEGRLDRGEGRLDRGDGRMDRGLPRNEGRLDRGDNRLDRGDNLMDHRRGEQPPAAMDQRGFRQGRGMGPGPGDGRGAIRGVDSRSPVDNRSFEFDRRDVVGGRPGDREGRMDRDRDLAAMGQLPPRDRFLPGAEFRRDDPGFRDNIPEAAVLRDRRGDDRFMGHEGMDLPPRGDRRFDDVRDDRIQGRGQGDDPRQGRDRMLPPIRGGHFDFGRGPGPEVRPPELLPNQRRGPLLPTPVEEPPRREEPPVRRGGRGEGYDRDSPRVGRDGPRDGRGRREQRDADFGPEMGRGGRDVPREGMREPAWDRDGNNKDGRPAGRDPLGRRSYGTPGGEDFLPEADKNRDADRLDSKRRDRDRSPRRDGDKAKDSPAQDGDPASKRQDKKEVEQGSGGKDGSRPDGSDARSTRSADDVRELSGQRGKEGELAAAGGTGSGLLKGVRDRDSRSDGKRSPDASQGKAESSLSGRRPPVRARSLSPKQRSRTPAGSESASRSPGRRRSPSSRRGGDQAPSPASRSGRGGRSRTPVGTKRKMEEDLRSPRGGKDDTKSPVAKRAREDSRSPTRKGSRHPSPAGSHQSRGSHSSVERRRRPGGLTQREPESRFFGSVHDRESPGHRDRERERESPAWRDRDKDSPARRDRDRDRDKDGKMEKASESSKTESEGSRKRGRSPPKPHSRGSDSGDRGRKRWRGDGTWSEADGGDGTDKEGHKQKSEPPKAEEAGESTDANRTPSSGTASLADVGKGSRSGRGEGFGGRAGEDRAQPDGYPVRGEDRGQGRDGVEGRGESSMAHDSADDSKDASLKNMLYDDYEKISSDESDFEAEDGDKQTQNIVSVLDIDWASLAKQPTPRQTTGSLLKRFHPANVFRQIGISRALAGDSLFEKVEAICKEGVPLEDGKENVKDKENVDQSSETAQTKGVKKLDTSLLSDVPVLHMASVRQKRERANLLRNLGPFRRALCARRDLEIRRQLCKVDKVYEQPAVFPTHVMDTDLCKLSMQLFRQGRDFVERKDSECDGKMELAL